MPFGTTCGTPCGPTPREPMLEGSDSMRALVTLGSEACGDGEAVTLAPSPSDASGSLGSI